MHGHYSVNYRLIRKYYMESLARYMVMFAAAAGISSACTQMEEMRTLSPDEVRPPVLNPIDIDEITVTEDNLDETVTFVWDAADFGVRTQVSYVLEARFDDPETGQTRSAAIQSGISSTSLEMTYENLNYTIGLASDLGGLGVPLETPSLVKFYVGASVGTSADVYMSEPLELKMSVIYAEPRYPNVWVIGKYSNWDHSRSQHLFSFGNDAEFEGIVDFGENAAENNGGSSDDVGFKLTGAANWNNATGNWGVGAERPEAEAEEITLVNNGGNIANVFTKRYYSFAYNTTTLELVRQYAFDRLVVYGSALGETEQTMLFNTLDQKFWLDVTLAEGILNFALVDGQERTVLGSVTAGQLDGTGDNPVAAAAGNYRIYVNLNNSEEKTYVLNADDYGKEVDEEEEITDPTGHTWGIVGTMNYWGNADAEGEKEPDLAMVLDGDYYVRRNVRLSVSDMFKIRYDNEWEDEDDAPMNFGAEADVALAPADGSVYMAASLVSNGGGNISVSVDGEYDIYFNVTLGYLHVRPAGSDAPGDIAWGLTGSFTGWTPGEDLQMTAAEGSGQEYYVYEGLVVDETATFKFRYGNMFKNGSDNVFGLPSGTSGPVALNVPVNLDADGAAADLEIAAGTYNMVLYPTQRVAYVIEQNAGINVPDRITWGISGTMTGWADNMDILMTQSGGYYVAENIHVPAGAEFKFRYGNNWNGNNYGFPANESVAASDNVLALVSGGAGNLTVQAEGDYDFYLNPDYGFLYVKAAGSPAPAAVSFGINAGITADMPDLTMIQSGNEFVCTNVRFPESDAFRIRISNNDGLVYGGTWAGTDVAMAAVEGGPAISVLPGLYNIYFDYSKKEIRVSGSVSDPHWGIVGTFSNWTNDRIMYEEDGYFVYRGLVFETDNVLISEGNNSNAFKLRYGWNWNLGSVGAGGDKDLEVTANTAVPVINNGGSKNLIVPDAGTYDIYYDAAANMLYVMDAGKTPADADEPEPAGRSYFIRGEAASFGWDAGAAMSDEGDYVVIRNVSRDDLVLPFKLYDSSTGLWYGRGGGGDYVHPVPVGEGVDLYNNNHTGEGQSNIRLDESAAGEEYDVYFVPPAGTAAGDTGRIYIVNVGEVPAI